MSDISQMPPPFEHSCVVCGKFSGVGSGVNLRAGKPGVWHDIAYVSKDQAETSVLFELIGTRYERRSMLITANQPFGAWSKVFPDQAMTLAAIDRLVHHSTILEMNVESYRRRAALDRKRGRGRAPTHATIKDKG